MLQRVERATRAVREVVLEKTGLDGLNNMLLAYEDKTAYAQCVFAYCEGGEKSAEEVEVFVGRTNGRIVKARGKTEFGWDSGV